MTYCSTPCLCGATHCCASIYRRPAGEGPLAPYDAPPSQRGDRYQDSWPCDQTRLGQFISEAANNPLRSETLPIPPDGDRPSPPPFFRLRLLALGVPYAVDNCRLSLHRLGYADPNARSIPLPIIRSAEVVRAAAPGEIMRILTKRIPPPSTR
ncbi:MAG: hypothetical protein ACFB4J_13215 [Elainellaceae cyanobacterium]